MGHILLAALCLWSCLLTVTPLIDVGQAGRATNYIEQRFTKRFTYQYAYFVKFTADECNRGLTDQVLQEALKGEDAEVMYQEVDNYRIYNGQRMVASSYLKTSSYTLHAEFRLLDPDSASPISNLLSQSPPAGCAIFYSMLSPCITKCLDSHGRYNIITKLRAVQNLPADRAFAFNQVFWYDKTQPITEVERAWKSLNDFIHLLRCEGTNCYQCFINGVMQEQCLPKK